MAPDSPAQDAVLKRGDIILRLNDKKIVSMTDLPRLVAEIPVGEIAEVTVFRQGREKTFKVEVGKMDDDGQPKVTKRTNVLGLTVVEISPELRRRLNIQAEQGVVITSVEPNSAAAEAGLRPGDVVLEFNNQEIATAQEFQATLQQTDENAIQRLLIQRGKGLFFIAIKAKE